MISHTLNVRLPALTRTKLIELQQTLDIPLAAVIRQAIDYRWKMMCDGKPTCADGRPCPVPQMHAQPKQ